MNKSKLQKEGKKWIEADIISEEQLEQILALYSKKDPHFVLTVFAILLTGLGFLTFIFSDWAQVPHISRVLIVIIVMLGLYITGDILHRKGSILYGVSFILLGYIVFMAGLFLTIHIYQVSLFSAWPLVICSLVGMLLYALYEHRFLFVVGIGVLTIGQIYSGINFHSFDMWLFIFLMLGFTYFTYRHVHVLYSYLLAASFSIHVLVFVLTGDYQYYWLIVGFLLLYLVGLFDIKPALKQAFRHVSLLSIFLFGMFQSFLLQDDYFVSHIEIQISFFIIWFLMMCVVSGLIYYRQDQTAFMNLVLFLPVFILPLSYIMALVSLFLFSLGWLMIGYQREDGEKVLLGTFAFLLSTFTAYIQFAWDALNRSLFFLIGGILLFTISIIFERQRRRLMGKGGDDT